MPLANPVKQKRKIHEGRFEILYKKEGGTPKEKKLRGCYFSFIPDNFFTIPLVDFPYLVYNTRMRKNELRVWRENYTPWTKQCFSEGLRLEVHYEEKDFVKDIGGRWCPDPSGGKGGYWWMPQTRLTHKLNEEVPAYVNTFLPDGNDDRCSGMSVLDWLNLNRMIAGQHGEVTESSELLEATLNSTPTEHPCVVNGTKVGTFYVFEDLDVVSFAPRDRNPNYNRNWYTLDKAREVWDKLNKSQRKEMYSE